MTEDEYCVPIPLCTRCDATIAPHTLPPVSVENLRSNFHEAILPSHSSVQEALETLVSGYNDELQHYAAIVSELTKRRDLAAQRLEQHSSLSAPIRRLPPEILLEIFACCTRPLYSEFPNADVIFGCTPWQGYHCQPFRLAAVCKFWRDLALCRPQLWTCLAIASAGHIESPPLDMRALPPAALQLSLERSQSAPLTVFLLIQSLSDCTQDTLRPHSRRIVYLRITEHLGSGTSIQNLHLELPALEHFSYETLYVSTVSNAVVPESTPFLSSPRVHTVELYNCRSRFARAIPSDRRLGVKHLMIDVASASEALRILDLFPNLTSAEFTVEVEYPARQAMVTMTQVRSFTLRISSFPESPERSIGLTSLLDHLALPSLTSLSIHGISNHDAPPVIWEQESFRKFLSRSNLPSRLKTFELSFVAISEADLNEIFQLLPMLEELFLKPCSVLQAVPPVSNLPMSLSQLVRRPDSHLLPRLLRLGLNYAGFSLETPYMASPNWEACLAAVIDIVASRLDASSILADTPALKELFLELDFDSNNKEDMRSLAALESNRDRGLFFHGYSVYESETQILDTEIENAETGD